MSRARRPSRSDVSRPREDGYAYKKQFYRQADVAADYDFHRFGSPERQRRNRRKWRAIARALELAGDVRSVLDLPCGTGRFTGALAARHAAVVGGDISLEMLQGARAKAGPADALLGFVQADAETLPFGDAAFDCVVCIRFMFHVDRATRVRILREMRRVSRRWLVVDYRHRYTARWLKWRLGSALGLTRRRLDRVTRRELGDEFRAAGLTVRRVIPVARAFSDKWIVLGEPAPG
jgi:SAM-dependent methyltransferase